MKRKRENEIQFRKRCFFAVALQYCCVQNVISIFVLYTSKFKIYFIYYTENETCIQCFANILEVICKRRLFHVAYFYFLMFRIIFVYLTCCIFYLLAYFPERMIEKIGFMFSSILATTYNAFTT